MAENENETVATATNIDWASLSGTILDGGYEVKDILATHDRHARLRVRILGGGGQMGTAYFMQLEPHDAEDQIDIWYTLREVPHPNLSRPLAVGRREIGGAQTIYVVMADPDEKLLAVVPERPLEWEEAAEVLHSLEKGLAHLHSYGLVHGSVSPETVQAVGYTIQLGTISVRRLGTEPRVEWESPRYFAPESKGVNTTVEADVWCLGATLFEVLSQERFGTPGANLEQGLPLGAIVNRCLEKEPAARCKLKDAASFEPLPPPPPAPQPVAFVAPEAPAAPVVVAPEPPNVAAPEPVVVAEPVVAVPPPIPAPPPVVTAPVVAAPAPPPPAPPEMKPAEKGTAPPAPRPPVESKTIPPVPSRFPERPRSVAPPHPLTPKAAPARVLPPRQVTKEDMALVPLAKRQKKVQGKRQPVDARIRVLDPGQDSLAETEFRLGPKFTAKAFGVGKKPTFARGIVAGAAVVALIMAALWLIVIPKLQTPVEPLASSDSAQTAKTASNDDATSAGGAIIPERHTTPMEAQPIASSPSNSTVAAKPSDNNADLPLPAPRPQSFYRVVVAEYNNQQEAAHGMETMGRNHPELLLRVEGRHLNDRNTSYQVIVGGPMTQQEASSLNHRLIAKGLNVKLEKIN